jgi:uncharacterized protein YlzI (FlbEa/FlbD family)
MFLPLQVYEWYEDWEDEEEGGYWEKSEKNINISHIESFNVDDQFGDYTYITMISGREYIVMMNVEEFETLIRMQQIKPLMN